MCPRKTPGYGGIVLEPGKIRYKEIDAPLRSLIRDINCQPWIRTYGSCAGKAHHAEDSGQDRPFFIGLFVKDDQAGIRWLRSWVEEANRINGSTGLGIEVKSVHKHPLGQGSVEGWSAYRLEIHEARKGRIAMRPETYLRMIRSLQAAWNRFKSVPGDETTIDSDKGRNQI